MVAIVDGGEKALQWNLMALPLLLGLIIPARPLSAGAVANKDLNSTAAVTITGSAKLDDLNAVPSVKKNILEWVRAFNYADDPATSALKPNHELRGSPGLFVTDGSALPRSGGVNRRRVQRDIRT